MSIERHGDEKQSYYSPGIRHRYREIIEEASRDEIDKTDTYANIGYFVDGRAYSARVSASSKLEGLQKTVPEGWPLALDGPLVWSGGDFDDESTFIYHLTKGDIGEIDKALQDFRDQGLRIENDIVSPTNFTLPTLSSKLEALRDDVYNGKGFVIIRGLDTFAYSQRNLVTIYLGLTSYVAEVKGKQNQDGSMLVHILNLSEEDGWANKNSPMPFHMDVVCDSLCLLTVSCAAVGGGSSLASCWKVYNELAETRPDLIHTLSQPDWPFDTFGCDPPYYKRPLLFNHNGKIIMSFSRRLLCGTYDGKRSDIPGLTEAQAEALDAVDALARKHELRTTMCHGDIRIINNMALLHRKEPYEDSKTTERHLIRVWAHSNSHCWKLPESLQVEWASVFDDYEKPEKWPFMIRRIFKLGRYEAEGLGH